MPREPDRRRGDRFSEEEERRLLASLDPPSGMVDPRAPVLHTNLLFLRAHELGATHLRLAAWRHPELRVDGRWTEDRQLQSDLSLRRQMIWRLKHMHRMAPGDLEHQYGCMTLRFPGGKLEGRHAWVLPSVAGPIFVSCRRDEGDRGPALTSAGALAAARIAELKNRPAVTWDPSASGLDETVAVLEKEGEPSRGVLADARFLAADLHRARGQHERALLLYIQGLADLEAMPQPNPVGKVQVESVIGGALLALERADEARAAYARAIATCERFLVEDPSILAPLTGLASLLTQEDALAESEAVIQRAVSFAREFFFEESNVPEVIWNLGQLRLKQGRVEDARSLAERIVQNAEELGDRRSAAWGRTLLGGVACAVGDRTTGTRLYQCALEALPLSARGFDPDLELRLATALAEDGKLGAARALLLETSSEVLAHSGPAHPSSLRVERELARLTAPTTPYR